MNRKLYEGMFLVDSAQASDWDATTAILEDVLKRADAEIVSMRKWDDRRLAYEVNGKTRGTYILCYFKADGEKIQAVEKAVQLSERIMRVLILSAEQVTAEDMEKDTPAAKVEKEKTAAAEARAGKFVESAIGRKSDQEGARQSAEGGAATGEVAAEAETTQEDDEPRRRGEPKESEGSDKSEELKEVQVRQPAEGGEASDVDYRQI
ncbi:MAG: 30S ribosomal protein S6 [Phycisphaerae bacterium]|nr:30S ribosomal protein S6 [Phycisphaerae bacterium]